MSTLRVTSPAYRDGGAFPRECTCDGEGTSPPLDISGVPPGARFLHVVLDDPDAPGGTWTHWACWDLPAEQGGLEAGADVAALGGVEGRTSAGGAGYHGPCPPSGQHRYVVHAYATVDRLDLPGGAPVHRLQAALRQRAVAQGSLLAVYARA